jgi:hypothetical protein
MSGDMPRYLGLASRKTRDIVAYRLGVAAQSLETGGREKGIVTDGRGFQN